MEKHSIEDYLNSIGAAVPARAGGWRKMRCPFHEDGTASATVNLDTNRFKCFGCGVSGDTYDLIMHRQGGTLGEAIEFAQTISPESNGALQRTHQPSRGISRHATVVGRRSSHVSFGSGRRSSSGS